MVAWFSVPRSQFKVTRGTPVRFSSSARGTRSFCGQCGSALTFESADFPQEIDVTTCTLDDPEQLPPKDHTWVRSRLGWVHVDDGLPEYDKARSMP
jgi:hypothetical protein